MIPALYIIHFASDAGYCVHTTARSTVLLRTACMYVPANEKALLT